MPKVAPKKKSAPKPAPKKKPAPRKDPNSVEGLEARLDKIDAAEKDLKEKSVKLHESISAKRDRKDDAKNDQRKEDLADQIEVQRAERRRIENRLRRLGEREDKVENKTDELRKELHRVAVLRRKNADYASEHFAYAEFNCHSGQPVPEESKPAIRDWALNIGEPARLKFGAVFITSGFRPEAYNASIGGATNSVHIYDYPGRDYKAVAVDWHAENGSPAEWAKFAKEQRADGIGTYPSSGFTHTDNRSAIGWADAEWSG